MLSSEVVVMAAANPLRSRLESLPTELLEQIFLQSLNINLPLASSHLGTVFSSTSTKMAVVLKVFPSKTAFTLEHYGELRKVLRTKNGGNTGAAIGELQSRVLACRWMTWDFLKLCMETFVVRTLVREFRDQSLPWQEGLPVDAQSQDAAKLPWHGGAPVKESVVRDFVHEVFALQIDLDEKDLDDCEHKSGPDGMENDKELNRGYQRLGVRKCPESINDIITTSSLRTYSWGPGSGTPRISIGIGPRNGLVILGTRLKCEADSKIMEMTSRRWKCLRCLEFNTRIPVKLLHGPWTQDKLSFLQALIEGGAFHLPKKTNRELAKKGLTEAIREDNYRVIDLLITETLQRQYSQYHKENYFEPSFVETEFVMDVWDDPTDWIRYPRERKRRTLDIKPDTEHLRLAVIERGCRRKIVKRLLWAEFSDIDRADPAVVDWAETKNEQGDGIGQWLLDQLSKSWDQDYLIM